VRYCRREGLYSSHLTHWRREVDASEQAALAPERRGPKPDLAKAESRRVEALEREVIRLRQKLGRAEQIIEAQSPSKLIVLNCCQRRRSVDGLLVKKL
jgi:transposase